MQILNEFKRGDTFVFYANIADGGGNPLTGQVNNLRCQIRTKRDVLVCTLIIAETVTTGQYQFTAPDTSGWSIGDLYLDIQMTQSGVVTSSETIVIPVIKDVTI